VGGGEGAAADAQLVELEGARARAERPYGKRRRVVEGARGRIHEIRAPWRRRPPRAGSGRRWNGDEETSIKEPTW
jgi:hypothetical protein